VCRTKARPAKRPPVKSPSDRSPLGGDQNPPGKGQDRHGKSEGRQVMMLDNFISV